MGRIVVIGDVGGHADQLRWALRSVGIEDEIPEDMTVIQAGDLVDRGPASAEVLAIVGQYLARQPKQWIQLAGNHEAQYLPGGSSFWGLRLADSDADLLRTWWDSHAMRVAAAVRLDDGDEFLICHAGLTVNCWRELGEPMTAAGAAMLLNDRPQGMVFRGWEGEIGGPGPLWAEAGSELHEPWMDYYNRGGFVPFGQIHGHSSIFRYPTQTWRAPEKVRLRATVDDEARHVRVRIGGRQFIGIDPKHGRESAPKWQPLILDGSVA